MAPTLSIVRDWRKVLASPQVGFDAWRVVYLIGVLQAMHWLVLGLAAATACAALHPQSTSAPGEGGKHAAALRFAGGSLTPSLVFDWRLLAARPSWWGPWTPQDPSVSFIPGSLWMDRPSQLAAANQGVGGGPQTGTGTGAESAASAASQNKIPLRVLVLTPDQLKPISPTSPSSSESAAPSVIVPDGRKRRRESAQGPQPTLVQQLQAWVAERMHDPVRVVAILFAWVVATGTDTLLLVMLVRRPSHMLDHMLTLHLIHVVAVSLWSASVPASPRYWLIVAAHVGLCTIASEMLAARTTAKRWATQNEMVNRAAAATDFDVPEEQHELQSHPASASSSVPYSVSGHTAATTGKDPTKATDKFVLFDEDIEGDTGDIQRQA